MALELRTDIFSILDKGWALLTAGDSDHFNTMTVSWGALGTIWGSPAATVYVRESRYTLEFMKKSEYFTLSFFPEQYRKDLEILGSKSGRDGDKIALTDLHPEVLAHGVGFQEASLTLICKKQYMQEMDPKAMPEAVLKQWYPDGDNHIMFIGEVIDKIEKN